MPTKTFELREPLALISRERASGRQRFVDRHEHRVAQGVAVTLAKILAPNTLLQVTITRRDYLVDSFLATTIYIEHAEPERGLLPDDASARLSIIESAGHAANVLDHVGI